MAAKTYTVKWGDTLSELAVKYETTVSALVKLNDITDPDFIVVGQVLKLSGEATKAAKNTSSKAKIKAFGLQSNTTNTVYATWTWDKTNTDNYQLKWEYYTGDGVWFIGNESTVTAKQSTYSAPSNATSVRFRVKPISKTKKVKNKDVHYWTASWSDVRSYSFSKNPPTAPPTPTVAINGTKLTASLSNIGNTNATIIQFDIARDDAPSYKKAKVKVSKTSSATYECTIELGSKYKVRCRGCKSEVYSDWSAWSNELLTVPKTPSEITECRTGSAEELIVKWNESTTATSYEVQYTTLKSDFTSDTPKDIKTVTVETNSCTITDTESGTDYYVRVRAKNSIGESEWTSYKSTVTGSTAAAPTTWSSSLTVVAGEPLTLYWMHNSEDGSDCTYADLELYVNGVKTIIPSFDYTKDDGTVEKEATKSHSIDTSAYDDEGAQLQWRVRTAGATKALGEWSILRVVNVYVQPELELVVTDNLGNLHSSETESETSFDLTSFPIHMTASASPDLQRAIGYHVSITANEDYETIDNLGNADMVTYGEEVYSKHFDTLDESAPNSFSLSISAGDVNLDPNISYTITCTVTMNSGLVAEASLIFLTVWEEVEYDVNAEIGIDKDNYTASIRPYCVNAAGNYVEDTLLFVYRREFDGSFTEIASDIVNGSDTFVTDPHPALDYARYRVTAMNTATGAMSYNDIPGYYVGCKAVIIQWDEQWSEFDVSDGDFETPTWSGSLLMLPYNIDISDKNSPDVSLIEYIGRDHPVSYYGTQLGTSSTWNVVIDKKDNNTLYALRRLSRWMGNVYVREPSGSGYWANVTVSFSQKHLDLTIPVTLSVNRVEGGA